MKSYLGRKEGSKKILLSRDNIRGLFQDDPNTYLLLGGASSEILAGKTLGKMLAPAVDYFSQHVHDLESGIPVQPLHLHTSVGVTPHVAQFLQALEPHLPESWQQHQDWSVSLQLEGSSAVHTAIDVLTQYYLKKHNLPTETHRLKVAVGKSSYHGPASNSFGRGGGSTFIDIKQISYPVPLAKFKTENESDADFFKRIELELNQFLEQHHQEIPILLIEPQWGSGGEGQRWPESLLRSFVAKARSYGILVISDEIMCGLGRHGREKTFLVDSLDIEVDAILFGKSIATGAFSLSGAIFREGAQYFQDNKISPLQTHTYSHGAQVLTMLSAIQVLRALPEFTTHVQAIGEVFRTAFNRLPSHPALVASGQGCLWGLYLDYNKLPFTKNQLQRALQEAHVIVYFIPEGILMTPIYNAELPLIREATDSIVSVLQRLMDEN